MNDATGVATGMRREFETLFRAQAERILRDLDVVQREEFEAVKEMARLAREENEALKARIAALEARLGGGAGWGVSLSPPVWRPFSRRRSGSRPRSSPGFRAASTRRTAATTTASVRAFRPSSRIATAA